MFQEFLGQVLNRRMDVSIVNPIYKYEFINVIF